MAGPFLLKEKSKAFMEYAAFRIRVIHKALRGIEQSENADSSALLKELNIWKEIINESNSNADL